MIQKLSSRWFDEGRSFDNEKSPYLPNDRIDGQRVADFPSAINIYKIHASRRGYRSTDTADSATFALYQERSEKLLWKKTKSPEKKNSQRSLYFTLF